LIITVTLIITLYRPKDLFSLIKPGASVWKQMRNEWKFIRICFLWATPQQNAEEWNSSENREIRALKFHIQNYISSCLLSVQFVHNLIQFVHLFTVRSYLRHFCHIN
jgi:hypothetical protein